MWTIIQHDMHAQAVGQLERHLRLVLHDPAWQSELTFLRTHVRLLMYNLSIK